MAKKKVIEKPDPVTEPIIHEEVKVISVRPVYTIGRSPTVAITYRLKGKSMKVRPGDVLAIIKNPARQGKGE